MWNTASETISSAVGAVQRAIEVDVRGQAGHFQVSGRVNGSGSARGSMDVVANPALVSLSASAGVRLSDPEPGSTQAAVTARVARYGPVTVGIRTEIAAESTGVTKITAIKGNASVGVNIPGWTQPVTPSVNARNIGCIGDCPGGSP